MRTVQQLSTNSTRTAGRDAFVCAAAMVAARPVASASGLESFGLKPCMHGYRDRRKFPGQEDV